MSTKADFYEGKGPSAKWIGSISWEGRPSRIPRPILTAKTNSDYEREVTKLLRANPDSSLGSGSQNRWPWPWANSTGTSYSYSFTDGKVEISHFGGPWCDPLNRIGYEFPTEPKQLFPDMSKLRMAIVGQKSGLVVVPDSETNNHTRRIAEA